MMRMCLEILRVIHYVDRYVIQIL